MKAIDLHIHTIIIDDTRGGQYLVFIKEPLIRNIFYQLIKIEY